MHITRRALLQATTAACGPGLPSRSAFAADADDFFRGKTVRILVGTTAGAGYDLVARVLAVHLPRHIAGAPSVVVENMPGAGSLTMANYLYNRASRDGSVIGLPLNGIILEPSLQLLSRSGGAANFDLGKMSWLGSTSEEPQVLWVFANTDIRSFADLRNRKVIFGASGLGADNYLVSILTNNLLGARLEIVPGYSGTNDVFLAAERGEVEGSCTAYSAIAVGRPQWLSEKRIRILAQYGSVRTAELPDVPTAMELVDDPDLKKMFLTFATKFRAAYPFLLPPGVEAARVEHLQQAFEATVRDEAFVADIRKSGMGLKPVTGREIASIVEESRATPDAILTRLRSALNR